MARQLSDPANFDEPSTGGGADTGGDTVSVPSASEQPVVGDAATAPLAGSDATAPGTPLSLASGGASGAQGRPTTTDRVLATRTMVIGPNAPHVEYLAAQSVKVIRSSDPAALLYFTFENTETIELFVDQFFTPGGVFRQTKVTADRPTTIIVQFGAKFSG